MIRIQTSRWYLSHAEWRISNWWGDYGQPETGVRPVVDGKVDTEASSFQLIQHGWWDFVKATDFILKALDKGWNAYRISKVMWWMNDRGCGQRKAKVL